MTPCEFPEANIRFGEGQPEYQVLPAVRMLFNGEVVTCWRPSWVERLKLLWTGRVWVHQLTFDRPLQPLIVTVHKLFTLDPDGRQVAADGTVADGDNGQ